MRRFLQGLAIVAFLLVGFVAGFEFHQPREIIVDRWHKPKVWVIETVRYEPLPDEYIDVAIRGLEQAIYSHQYYINHEDVSEGSMIWHQRTIDKYEIAITALESLK